MKNKLSYGFSLVEVLISLFLLSLILFGLESMEWIAFRQSREAWFMNVATNQLVNITEWLKGYAKNNNIKDQVNLWNQQNAMLLPQGKGNILENYPVYTITIFWGERNSKSCKQNQIGEKGCLRAKITV